MAEEQKTASKGQQQAIALINNRMGIAPIRAGYNIRKETIEKAINAYLTQCGIDIEKEGCGAEAVWDKSANANFNGRRDRDNSADGPFFVRIWLRFNKNDGANMEKMNPGLRRIYQLQHINSSAKTKLNMLNKPVINKAVAALGAPVNKHGEVEWYTSKEYKNRFVFTRLDTRAVLDYLFCGDNQNKSREVKYHFTSFKTIPSKDRRSIEDFVVTVEKIIVPLKFKNFSKDPIPRAVANH